MHGSNGVLYFAINTPLQPNSFIPAALSCCQKPSVIFGKKMFRAAQPLSERLTPKLFYDDQIAKPPTTDNGYWNTV